VKTLKLLRAEDQLLLKNVYNSGPWMRSSLNSKCTPQSAHSKLSEESGNAVENWWTWLGRVAETTWNVSITLFYVWSLANRLAVYADKRASRYWGPTTVAQSLYQNQGWARSLKGDRQPIRYDLRSRYRQFDTKSVIGFISYIEKIMVVN